MSFLKPSYIGSVALSAEEKEPIKLRNKVKHALNALQWELINEDTTLFQCFVPPTMNSLGEVVEIILDSDSMKVSSVSANNQLFSKKIQQNNVIKFLQTFQQTPTDSGEVEVIAKSSTKINTLAQITAEMQIWKATMVIIAINAIVFMAMIALSSHDKANDIINPSIQLLTQWGANGTDTITHSQWWRLISSMFLHVGIFHLFANMYALFYIGSILENRIWTSKLIIAYILSGLIASIASLYFNDSNIISAGASGAIFGLCGVFLLTLIFWIFPKNMSRQLITSMLIFIIFNIIYGFIESNIDNIGHIAGLFGWLIIGLVVIVTMRVDSRKAQIWIMWSWITFIMIWIIISCILIPKTNAFFLSYYNLFADKDQKITHYIQSNIKTQWDVWDIEANMLTFQTALAQWDTAEVSLQQARWDIKTPSLEQQEIINLIGIYIEGKKKIYARVIWRQEFWKEKEIEIIQKSLKKIASIKNIDSTMLEITSQDFVETFVRAVGMNNQIPILLMKSPDSALFPEAEARELQNNIQKLSTYIEQIDISHFNTEQMELVQTLKQYLLASNNLIVLQDEHVKMVTKQRGSTLEEDAASVQQSLLNLQQKMNIYTNR
jgi:membrane associated rhomboid family serine protease